MITLVTLIAIGALASSEGWTVVRHIDSADGVPSTVWALDAGQGPRWTVSSGGELLWSSARQAIRDSLILPLQIGETGEAPTLEASAVLSGPPGLVFCEFAVLGRDGGIDGLNLSQSGPAMGTETLRGLRLVSPVQRTVAAPLGENAAQLVVRVGTSSSRRDHASVRFRSITVRSDRGEHSLVPLPIACDGDGPRLGPAGGWWLPHLPSSRWRMGIPGVVVEGSQVLEVSCPLGGVVAERPPKVLWRLGDASDQWRAAPTSWRCGDADTLVAVIARLEGLHDTVSVGVDAEVGEDGATAGPVLLRTRAHAPSEKELALVQVVCAPAEAEFLEVQNWLRWSLPLSSIGIDVDGRLCRCGQGSIPAEGFAVIRRGDCPGLVLPNEHAEIRLLWEDTEIDRLSFGPNHTAPAPPYGWSLRKGRVYTLDRAPIPGGNSRPEPPTAAVDSMALSEIMLWPLDSPGRFIEIENHGGVAVSLAGWAVVCEDALALGEWAIVAPRGLLTIPADSFPASFALNPDTGDLTLVDCAGRIVDRVRWTVPPPPDHSLCHTPALTPGGEHWVAGSPTPGTAGRADMSLVEIEISLTPEGRCVQWHYPHGDHPAFWVYRAPALEPQERTRVNALPIVGAPPLVLVDIDASSDEAYLYWLGVVITSGEEILAGPVLSPAEEGALELTIGPATPNPFRTSTVVPYSIAGLSKALASVPDIPSVSRLHLGVYTLGGRLVRMLATDSLQDGEAQVAWDGRDDTSRTCPPGVYVLSLQVGEFVRSTRVVFAGQ